MSFCSACVSRQWQNWNSINLSVEVSFLWHIIPCTFRKVYTHLGSLVLFSEFLLTLSSHFTSFFFSLILTARSHFQTERIFFSALSLVLQLRFRGKIMSVAKPRAWTAEYTMYYNHWDDSLLRSLPIVFCRFLSALCSIRFGCGSVWIVRLPYIVMASTMQNPQIKNRT